MSIETYELLITLLASYYSKTDKKERKQILKVIDELNSIELK